MVSRDVALNTLPTRGISVNPASTGSATITLVASDSGVMNVNKLASPTAYTLPACTLGEGKIFWFYDAVGQNIAVTSPTATKLYGPVTLSTTATLTGAIGGCGFAIGDGTYYYFFALSGSWAVGA